MTVPDPRSWSTEGQETPLDGTATIRTDATVHPYDADALDAWLESVTTDGERSIGNSNGSSPHRRMANGSGPSASDTPLVATARQFHARIGDAEASHATDIPRTIIWERIMSSQLANNQSAIVQPSPRSSMQARPPARADEAEGHPFPVIDRFAGSHPAFSVVLAAAVILAIVAIFRVIGAPPSGPTDDPTIGSGPSANPALAVGSPLASPSAFDCAGPVRASNGSASKISDYVPLTPVTDPALIDKANATFTIALECSNPDIPNQPNAIPPIVMTDVLRERIEAVRMTWPVDPWGFAASFDPDAAALIDFDGRAKFTSVVPEAFFEMPNGRYGGIAYQVSELPEKQENEEPYLGLIAIFLSFRPGEGSTETPFVLTEYFPLCTDDGDGSTFCASAIYPAPANDPASTPVTLPAAIPFATPAASPVASNIERWIADPDAAACELDPANPPGAVNGEWIGSAPSAGLLPYERNKSDQSDCRRRGLSPDPTVRWVRWSGH